MKYTNYNQLEKDISIFSRQKKYGDAISLLDNFLESMPESEYQKRLSDILHYKAFLYYDANLYDEYFNTITKLLELGFACSPGVIRRMSLKNDERYQKIKEINDRLKALAQEKAKVEYLAYLPKDYAREKQYPLFMVLHGDGVGGNMHELREYWRPNVPLSKDFIVIYVQSSQVSCHNNYGWCYNFLTARNDVKECYDMVCQKYSVNQECVILGGFSGGALAVLDVTMANVFPVKGFISVCPEKTDSFTDQNVEAAMRRGVKSVFMEGERSLPVLEQEEMIQVFANVRFPFQYYISKGIGHAIPDDFDDKLEEALEFILSE